MSEISDIQSLVLENLHKGEDEKGLSEFFDQDFIRPDSEVVKDALERARENISPEDIFYAAYLYQANAPGYRTNQDRSQGEETLRLLFLWQDVESGHLTEKDLANYLQFLISRVEIRSFSKNTAKAISYIERFYGEDTAEFLADITHSKNNTAAGWIRGANPTKRSRQTIAAAAEVLYQLCEVKGWSEDKAIDWFERHAEQEIKDSATSYWNFFPRSVALKLEKFGLSVVGTGAWL